jgi:EpsI family protein
MSGPHRFIIVYTLIIITGLYINLHADIAVPINQPLYEFPKTLGSWQMVSEDTFSKNILDVLKPTDYLSRNYINTEDGSLVQLYIGYHNGSKDSGGIHSPKHCLPGSGWFQIVSGKFPIDMHGRSDEVVRAIYHKGEQKILFLYWFQMMGKIINNEYALKVGEITNSLRFGRRDEAFIRISVPSVTDQGQAEETAKRFAREFKPVIDAFLPS